MCLFHPKALDFFHVTICIYLYPFLTILNVYCSGKVLNGYLVTHEISMKPAIFRGLNTISACLALQVLRLNEAQ